MITFDLRKEAILATTPGTWRSRTWAGLSWRIRTMGTASGTRWIRLSSSATATGPKYHHQLVDLLAAWPLASSGFAAIECFRASPYGGIYILKNYSKLTAKKSANFFFSKIQNFFCLKPSPDQDGTNKKRIFQIGPSVPEKIGFKHTFKDRS